MKFKLSDFVEINPKETLPKYTLAKKIAMEKLQPFCREVSGYDLEKFSGGSKFRNGDTIMARITPCLENGKIAQINILDKEEVGFGSTEFLVFRAKKGFSDPNFIYYLIISELVRIPAIKSMVGSSGRQRVQTSVLENLEIDLPDLETQKKIAKVLSALDDKIELNNQINKNLEEQAQALYKSWFVDFEPFGGVVPADWSLTNLSDIAEFVGGYSYTSSELRQSATAMATIKNFDRNKGFKLEGYKEIAPSSKLKICQYADLFDTLVAHTDLTQKAEVIGNAELLLSKCEYENVIFSMDLVKVVPKNKLLSKFIIAAILQDKRFKEHCLGYVNGTTVLHLSKRALPDYRFLFPSKISMLNEFSATVEAMYRSIALNIDANIWLCKVRDTLLPKLMSGEIDVDNVKI